LVPPLQKPTQTLTDTSGKPWSFAADGDTKATLLYFGYTHCPDVCPTTMADIHQALEHVSPAVRANTQVVFVTVDPDHDPLSRIRTWLNDFDPSFIGLRGKTYADIVAMSNTVDAGVSDTPPTVLPNGTVDVEHGSQLIGLTPHGGAPVFWIPAVTGPTLQSQLEHDIPLLTKGVGG
jgi:protein SCO1/2